LPGSVCRSRWNCSTGVTHSTPSPARPVWQIEWTSAIRRSTSSSGTTISIRTFCEYSVSSPRIPASWGLPG
jgi:hypothetical protein